MRFRVAGTMRYNRTQNQQSGKLIPNGSLAEIMKTPVLDAEGNLNSATAQLQAKYRTI